MYLDTEEDWMMQTSSGYEYDCFYENTTRVNNLDTHKQRAVTKSVTMETTRKEGKAYEINKNVQQSNTVKTESREDKIKSLKALLRKQEKAVNKLKPDDHKTPETSQEQNSVATSAKNKCGKSPKTNRSPTAKGCSKEGLGTKVRRSRRRKVQCDSVSSCRDVDIWMSRGELITKDEFLAVVGLVRVAQFHENV